MNKAWLWMGLTLVLALSAGTAFAGDDCDTLADWMCGSFSSAAQAEADTNFFDIRLEMVRIWPQETDAVWIYVEQAAAWSLEKPYRQRVYRVTEIEPGLFKSAVFSFEEPLNHAGAWKQENPLGDLTPAELQLRDGCAVFLRKDQFGQFMGGTIGRGCGSGLHGAAYATSRVLVTDDRIESWDQGFDARGEQVWGAETGPYLFLRSAEESTE